MKRFLGNNRGSLALEQVLFIGAIVGMSAGIFAFYDELRTYFQNVTLPTPSVTNTASTAN